MEFQNDWNRLYEHYELQNENKVALFLVDGPNVNKLRKRYKVNGFPSIIYVKAGTKGLEANEFDEFRDFNHVKDWIDLSVKRSDAEI